MQAWHCSWNLWSQLKTVTNFCDIDLLPNDTVVFSKSCNRCIHARKNIFIDCVVMRDTTNRVSGRVRIFDPHRSHLCLFQATFCRQRMSQTKDNVRHDLSDCCTCISVSIFALVVGDVSACLSYAQRNLYISTSSDLFHNCSTAFC